jgi:N-acetylglucosaminyldiphosphoundecaprenol N-acetyl-beta-D-mannosaminyltransferase
VKKRILGIPVDILKRKQLEERLDEARRGPGHSIVTLNPEIVLEATANTELRTAIEQAELVIPDGIGIQFANRYLGNGVGARMAGIDLMHFLVHKSVENNDGVFLLGGQPGVARDAARKLQRLYPGVQIVGAETDYRFWGRRLSDDVLCQKIRRSGAGLLFVAFGSPRQETWIAKNLPRIPNVKRAIGVGGSFDFLSGRVRRAPRWLQRIGLEWFWRLLVQPWRAGRIVTATIRFPLYVLRFRTNVPH